MTEKARIKSTDHANLDVLSEREIEVLTLVAHGKTYATIAEILSMSKETVKDHLERIGKKLNTTNKTHSAAIAVALGLIEL